MRTTSRIPGDTCCHHLGWACQTALTATTGEGELGSLGAIDLQPTLKQAEVWTQPWELAFLVTVLNSRSDVLVMTAASHTSSLVVSWTPPSLMTSTFTSYHSKWILLPTISLRCAHLVCHQQAQGQVPALPSQFSNIPDSSSQTMALHQLCKLWLYNRVSEIYPVMINIYIRNMITIIVLFIKKKKKGSFSVLSTC